MATWYRVSRFHRGLVEPVEVTRETEKQIEIGGRKRKKRGGLEDYFRTEREAWEQQKEQAEHSIAAYQRTLQKARSWLGQVEAALKKLPSTDTE